MTDGALMPTILAQLRGPMSLADWKDIGRKLAGLEGALNWALGYWLVYGQGRGDFGDTYTIAEEITGRSLESLSQCARVAEGFPPGTSVKGLSWSMHREVLRLPEDRHRETLELAKTRGWNRIALIGHIADQQRRTIKAVAGDDAMAGTTIAAKVHRWRTPGTVQAKKHLLRCPRCGKTFDVRRRALDQGVEVES